MMLRIIHKRWCTTTSAAAAWSGTSNRTLHRLDSRGGCHSDDATSTEPKPPTLESPLTLWVNFPTYSKIDVQAFNDHVETFCIPPNHHTSLHGVERVIDAAPPQYQDWVFRTDEQNQDAASAIHLSFQTSLSSAQKIRIFATPSLCLTQITDNGLDISEIINDLNDGVGPGSVAEIVVRIIEELVVQNTQISKAIDDGIGSVEEKVLGAQTWGSGINDEVLNELSSLRFRAVRQRRVPMAQMTVFSSFLNDVQACQPENAAEASNRRELILAEVTKNEVVRLVSAKTGFTTALDILDGIQDRAVYISSEIGAKNSAKTNKLLTILSILTGALLPLQMVIYYVEGVNVGWLHWPV